MRTRRGWGWGIAVAGLLGAGGARALEAWDLNNALRPEIVIHGPNAGDAVGELRTRGPAVGDLSGDGIADVVLPSVASRGLLDGSMVGTVHVIFGPLTGVRDLATTPADVTIHGDVEHGFWGSDVHVADMNGDTAPDLLVARRGPLHAAGQTGEICMFFGPLAPAVMDLRTSEPDACIRGRGGDGMSYSFTVADVNGDGIPDLVAGTRDASSPSVANGGGIVAIHGPFAAGPVRDLALDPPDVRVLGNNEWSVLGDMVCSADVSGDGIADLVAGGRSATGPDGELSAGEVVVVFGGLPSGTVIDLAVTPPDVLFSGSVEGQQAGFGLACGDATGDGIAELFVGLPGTVDPYQGQVGVLIGPIPSGTVVDNRNTHPDITFHQSLARQLGRSIQVATSPTGPRVIINCGSRRTACPRFSGHVYMHGLPADRGVIDLSTTNHAIDIMSDEQMNHLADLDGDGEPELLLLMRFNGPDGDRPDAYALVVAPPYVDRCEEAPPGLGPSGLKLTRSGDDVVLHFDDTGTGVEGMGVDAFRGTLYHLRNFRPGNHAVLPECGFRTSPAVDAGGAAPGMPTYYYLATRGCPDACSGARIRGDIGWSSQGEARYLALGVPDDACP